MQAIRTRYYGATNTRGSRIVAKCEAGTLSMPYNHALNIDGNHAEAAQMMLQRMGWTGVYHGGVFNHDYYWTLSQAGWMSVASIDPVQSEAA